jgi:hypothetical protein
MRREVTVHAVGLDERHGGRDGSEELVGDRLGRGGSSPGGSGLRRGLRFRHLGGVPVSERFEEARQTGMSGHDVALAALEQSAPLARDRVRVLEVLLEEISGETRIQPVDVGHYCLCSNGVVTRADCS